MQSVQRREFLQWVAALSVTHPFWSGAVSADDGGKTKPKIKIGQIGVGHAHASKLSVYRASPDYEVVGIVEPNAERRQQAESQATYRDLRWMTREQLLNVPGLQAVLVETEVKDLLDNAEVAVQAGLHVHLDKPAGESLPQYRRILAQAAKTQRLVQMGYMYRYNPGVLLLREALQQGWLGDLFEVHTVMSKVVDARGRQPLAQFPGGMMFELGCHVIDLVIGVLGRPTSITSVARHSSSLTDQLQDNMLAVFEYPRALATVKSSALEVDGGERRHFVACGTGGTLQIQPLDNPSVRLTFSGPHGEYRAGYQDVKLPKFTRYVADAADMARIIRGEKASDFSYEHDLIVQESVLRAGGQSVE